MKPRKLGEILIELGLINAEGLKRALEVQAREGGTLTRVVSGLGLVDEKAVSSAIADWFDFECLERLPVAPETARLIPPEFCEKRLIAAVGVQNRTLRLAMVDPFDMPTIQDVEFMTNMRVVPVVSTESAIREVLNRLHGGAAAEVAELLGDMNVEAEVEAVADEDDALPQQLEKDGHLPQTVRLVTSLLANAVKEGASDIHLEPQERGLQVRYRVDGLLQDTLMVPRPLQDATISRLKIMSGMDIAERRKPQDGRSQLKTEGRRIDLRVSTLPTQYGEKIVIRILDSSKAQIDMDQLGILPANLQKLQKLLKLPQGMILVTGPTGSGKTSTLYASLNWVKSPTKNIVTIEDPIEYRLPGINQVQINPKAGLTFASGLRSFLRQDPNVVLVGEIRDQETAGIALEASQTGHLLLSTLHTNDAAATITRLLDLGIEPFLVASSVVGILAQRLVRRVCPACAVETAPTAEAVETVGPARIPEDAVWKAGKGCDSCKNTGYKGRVAIHELLEVTEEVRGLIAARAADHMIRDAARRGGMRTLLEDGIAKAGQGLTTLEDVLRVAPRDEARGGAALAEPTPAVAVEDQATISTEPSITMPVETASPAVAISPGGLTPGAPPAPALTPPPGGIRVLVVEDSPTIVQVVKYFLELEGYQVFSAADGEKGLALARRERPHAVISDVEMPRMTGIEMVAALRRDPLTRDLPVLLLTSLTSVDAEAQGLAVGADDYVPKPVEPRRLAARVKALLSRTQHRWNRAGADAANMTEAGTVADVEAAPASNDGSKPKKARASRKSGKSATRKPPAASNEPAAMDDAGLAMEEPTPMTDATTPTPETEPTPESGVKEEPA
ncbi:MAG TPA: type II/IV secretion system protein [Methylomirabilota bacterium]|jgi:type IV pilus assembly protein PilB